MVNPKKMIKTAMLNRYMRKFPLRILAFLAVFALYITDKQRMYELVNQPLSHGISLFHILWVIFMGIMLLHLFPNDRRSMALRKAEKQNYVKNAGYTELELLRYVQDQNVKAWKVMLLWLCFNAIFGALYLFKVINEADLFMLTVFYFLSDYICILIFCPFQTFIMKNKCCVNCRIYDWGHFMMFTPMLFIKNFFCWSLFFTSLVVLIKWEITYAKYPERFYSGANATLQCGNCKDKTCQIKNRIKRK